ncbi:hypothetical protein BZZ01_32500 [Nostocales cyanobacterium HT-58-2]|nr:hypothetical protein BZZ01_32500 [Nostocales cyanobacterium HT-58-2]
MNFETVDDLIDFYLSNASHSFHLALESRNRKAYKEYIAKYEAWSLAAKAAKEFKDSLRPRA